MATSFFSRPFSFLLSNLEGIINFSPLTTSVSILVLFFIPLFSLSRIASIARRYSLEKTCPMTSFEPVLLLYGSPEAISKGNLSLPVKTNFAFNQVTLQQLLHTHIPLDVTTIPRYFLILLERISDDLLKSLQNHQRIEAIYSQDVYPDQSEPIRPIHRQSQQFTLDLVNDIVRFLTRLSEKQEELHSIPAGRIYCRQARILKEWGMSSMKVISLTYLLFFFIGCIRHVQGRTKPCSTDSSEYQ